MKFFRNYTFHLTFCRITVLDYGRRVSYIIYVPRCRYIIHVLVVELYTYNLYNVPTSLFRRKLLNNASRAFVEFVTHVKCLSLLNITGTLNGLIVKVSGWCWVTQIQKVNWTQGRHSSVDSSVATILWFQVQILCIPSMLFSFTVNTCTVIDIALKKGQ